MKLKTFDCGDTIVATAKEMLRARDEDKPFFLFLHFYDVHTDFTARAEYRDKFVGPYAGRLTGSTTQLVHVRDADERLGEADVKWLTEMYDAEINQLDDTLGRFFGWLAYTLSRSTRQDPPDFATRLFQYDQTHILTVLGAYTLPRNWQVGGRFRFVTGTPAASSGWIRLPS